MNKFLFLIIFLSVGLLAFGEAAVFRDVKGKVEYQLAGDDWMPAKVGASIPQGTVISTGFKSTAALEVMGSVIQVKPLTRMMLDELVRSASGTKTGLTLLAGKVKAEVKPSSEASATVFNVKSPTATASVRGTGFEFDGANILVGHGDVVFSNQWNIARSVQGGEFSSTGRGASVSPPVPVKPAEKPQITANGGSEQVDAMFQETPPSTTDGPSPPATDYGLNQVIDIYGDELIIDSGALTVVDEVKKAKDDSLDQQNVVPTFKLNLSIQ